MENRELWRKARTFSVEDKHRVIAEFLGGGVSKKQVWQKHTGQADDHGRILRWMREFGYSESAEQTLGLRPTEIPMKYKRREPETDKDGFVVKALQKRVIELEEQLRDAELKATAYSTMVDIAEEVFKVPIRKKFSTKPSK